MSAVGIQMCNGASEMPIPGGSNPLKVVCQCCPYGYHIDLDFVRFCEKMAKNSGEQSIGKRQRRERRRQRQSMEVLLGLTSPGIWKIEQLLPPVVQENSPNEVHTAPLEMSSFTYDNDGLKKAVLDFEATLERTSKKRGIYTDSDSLERCRPDRQSLHSKTNEYYKTNSSPPNTTYIDFDLMTMCSNGHSSATSPLQNIREQMAISLERMRELEDKVKTIPNLEFDLLTFKKENSFLQSRLEDLKKKLRTAEHNLENLRKAEKETDTLPLVRRPLMIDTGVTCSTITRDVGTAPVAKKYKDIGTEMQTESRLSLNLSDLNNTAKTTTRTTKVQVQPEIENKSMITDLYMKDLDDLLHKKKNHLSLKDLGSISLSQPLEKTSRGVQTAIKESVNLLQVVERREAGVQVFDNKQTRETGITAKPKYFDVALDIRPRIRDIGVSYDKITDFICDRCKNLKTRTVGIGDGDVRSPEQSSDATTLPERSKTFHFANSVNQKLTRNIAVGTVAPIRKLTSTKNVDTQDFSASRIKHIGMNTNTMKLVDIGVGSDSDLMIDDTFICAKCSSPAKSSPKYVPRENKENKDLQPSKIPRPKSLNVTPVMERKKFVRQDTYTKSLVGSSPTSESPKKSKPRVNLSSDKSEPVAEEKVEVIRRNKTKAKDQPAAEAEHLHKDLKDLQLEEEGESYSRHYDDYCYDYDENYGDQDSKRNSQLFPENVLFQPIQDEPREKIKPSKEMKAAMKVVNDSLNKYPGGLPRHLKNASNILQQEWFKISSTASANPLDVEDYLDSFEEVSSTLLEYVVNMVDNNGNTAMHYAVSHGNFDVVSILLDSKVCNINKPNAAGYTCIMLVSLAQVRSETHRQVVRRLFQLADVNIRAKQHGQTALMLAVSHGRLDMVKLLLEAGADPNIQDGDGSTALMCAAEHGHTDIVKHILAHPDCDPSIVDCDGSTALAIAMEAGNRDIGVLLYAREHFASGSRGSSPYTSIKRRSKTSSSPHCRTPTSPNPNRKSDHSM